MKSKSLILFLALMLGLSCLGELCINYHADDNSYQTKEPMSLIIEDANTYIAENYGIDNYYPLAVVVDGIRHEASLSIYKKHRLIGYYSEDFDLGLINPRSTDRVLAKKGDRYNKEGSVVYRYLGYDAEGRLLYNPRFPPDSLGSSPDDSGLVAWGANINEDWESIIEDGDRKEMREAVEENFRKSLYNTIEPMIYHYILYHSPSFQNNDEYFNTWVGFFEQLFTGDISRKINVVLLPTTNAKGLAIFKYGSGYYTAIYLEYQEKTHAFLKIHHVAVDEVAGSYRISPGTHSINTKNDFRILESRKKISIKAIKSDGYECVGHSFHPNNDGSFRLPLPGARVGTISPSSEFNYIYKYLFRNDKPHLVFYYKKRGGGILVPDREGNIVVSSKKYEVSKAIPTDENVRIQSFVDDADLCYVAWGGGPTIISIPVYVSGGYFSGVAGYVTKDIEYYKLHDHFVYKLKKLLVKNSKLSPDGPIEQYPSPTPRAESRIYSQNVVGLHLALSTIRAGGVTYKVSVSSLLNYDGGDGSGDGLNLLAIEAVAIDEDYGSGDEDEEDEDEFYLSMGSIEELISSLESACTVRVRNDYLSIAGRVISDDGIFDDRAPKPRKIDPRPVVLETPSHHIDNRPYNGDSLTRGTMVYEKELGFGPGTRNFDIKGNNVFIHTPTLNNTKMEDVSAFDQRTEEEKARDLERFPGIKALSLPLDHVTEFDLSTQGRHMDKMGYGTRDYEEHLKAKLIKLPFDSYISTKALNIEAARPDDKYFLPAGKLLRLEPKDKKVYLKAAPWAVEGLYHIKTYMVAENARDKLSPQDYVNLDYRKDAALVDIPVRVSGRLFDFTVEKILDPAYLSTDSGAYWDSGLNTKEARPKKRFINRAEDYRTKWTLPLTASKSPYKHRVKQNVKLGYPLIFSVKSMGTFFAKGDVVVLRPRFYHIDEDGSVSDRIALFYKREGSLVRLGSEEDELRNYAIFKSFAGLKNQDLIKDSQLLYGARTLSYAGEEDALIPAKDIPTAGAYMSQITRPVFISKPSYALSSSPFRVFGAGALPHPPGVSRERSGMSLQKWYGSYNLPLSTLVYAMDEEGEVDMTKRITGGSIGLSFDISLSRSANAEGFELGYVTDSYNGWKLQAYQQGGGLPEGLVLLYSLDQSMDEDFIIK